MMTIIALVIVWNTSFLFLPFLDEPVWISKMDFEYVPEPLQYISTDYGFVPGIFEEEVQLGSRV